MTEKTSSGLPPSAAWPGRPNRCNLVTTFFTLSAKTRACEADCLTRRSRRRGIARCTNCTTSFVLVALVPVVKKFPHAFGTEAGALRFVRGSGRHSANKPFASPFIVASPTLALRSGDIGNDEGGNSALVRGRVAVADRAGSVGGTYKINMSTSSETASLALKVRT